MTDLTVDDSAISNAATNLANFRNSVIVEISPPTIDACGSDQLATSFAQALSLMFGQDRTVRESWANLGQQLTVSVQAYNDADRAVATQGS